MKQWCTKAHGSGQWAWGNSFEDTYTSSENPAIVIIEGIARPRYNNKREVTPGDSLHEKDCQKGFTYLIDGCDTDTTTKKRGGNLQTKDGSSWSIAVKRDTTTTVDYCNNIRTSSMMPVDRDLAVPQIQKFCQHDFKDPTTKDSPHWYRNSGVFGGSLEVDIKFAKDQTNCEKATSKDIFWPDDCESTFLTAIDHCKWNSLQSLYVFQ